MTGSEISLLTENSRYLQAAALKCDNTFDRDFRCFHVVSDHRCSYLRLAPALGYPVALVDRRVLEAASTSTQLQVGSSVSFHFTRAWNLRGACPHKLRPERPSLQVFRPQKWSMSNFPCSLTRNITSHSMENLAFHSLLRWGWLYYQFSPTCLYISLYESWENVLFELGIKRAKDRPQSNPSLSRWISPTGESSIPSVLANKTTIHHRFTSVSQECAAPHSTLIHLTPGAQWTCLLQICLSPGGVVPLSYLTRTYWVRPRIQLTRSPSAIMSALHGEHHVTSGHSQ